MTLTDQKQTCREFRQVCIEGAREVGKAFAELEYANFNKAQTARADQLESDFDRTLKLLPKPKKQNKNP